MSNNYYMAPPPSWEQSSEKEDSQLAGWAREHVETSSAYLRVQPAYPFIQEGLDLINGLRNDQPVTTLSKAKTELTLRYAKELIASQTNLRLIPAFASDSDENKKQSAMLNKLYMGWQQATFADRALRGVWQYAVGGGTGYAGIRFDPTYYNPRKGEIIVEAYGPLDVLPLGLPKSLDIQKAYSIAVRVQTPIHEVIRKYPLWRDRIVPNNASKTMMGRGLLNQSLQYASAVLRRWGPQSAREQQALPWPTVDMYYIYVDDDSYNTTGQEIRMGTPGTNWEYIVPYVGQSISMGNVGDQPVFREATLEDCKLYPNRRMITCIRDIVLETDPRRQVNPWWHGKVPLAQFRADDWIWNYLGFPLTRAGTSLEGANNEILRASIDSTNCRLSPPRAYDRQAVGSALAQTMNTRVPNQVVGMDLSAVANPMKPLLDFQFYEVPQSSLLIREKNAETIGHQMGVQDAAALARARQLPASDSLEKLLEQMGPLIKDQSRGMEKPICELGEMWKCLVFQFYTAKRRLEWLGSDGVTKEDMDYNPNDLRPAQIPGYAVGTGKEYDQMREFADSFRFSVEPYSLHELNSTTRKLFHLQLMRSGFPIDWWTLAELFDIHNFGPKPKNEAGEEESTIIERWLAQKQMEARFQAALQGGVAQAQAEAQAGAGMGPGQGQGGGRPPSGQAPPVMEQRSDGRSFIRESKK